MIIKLTLGMILFVVIYLYLLSKIEKIIKKKYFKKNKSQYKNTIAGGLENDRINERQ
jgi:hypothetical protein